MAIFLSDNEAYNYVRSQGFEPLIDTKNFRMDIHLRVKKQRSVFGRSEYKASIPRANEKFFRWMWAHKPHYCEECMRPLPNYLASYCSHILTRGAHPEMATDPRNVNILCLAHHNQWENGNRKAMRIYPKNEETINELKAEYNNIRRR